MSFENLSSTWPDQPLTDPGTTADVVDLMVSLGDRRRGTLTVIICDPNDRYLATVAIDLPPDVFPDPAPSPSPAELFGTAMRPIIPAVHTAPGTGLILALGRPGTAQLSDLDHEWARAAKVICHATDIRLIGFYVATKDGIHSPDVTGQAAAA